MRSVQVNVSPEVCETIVDLAHRSRIAVVNVINTDAIHRDGMREERVAISFEASTPDAKKFVDTLLASEIFDPERVWVDVRERRAIVNHETLSRITYPWVMPPTDIVEDLYQFSHVTVGLIGRV